MANTPPLFTSNADTNDFMALMNSELFRSDAISPPDSELFRSDAISPPVMISESSPLPLNILLSDLPINDITSWNPVQPSLQEYVEHVPTPSYGWAELFANTSESTATPASPLTVSATRCTVKPGRSEVAGMVAMQDPTVLPLLKVNGIDPSVDRSVLGCIFHKDKLYTLFGEDDRQTLVPNCFKKLGYLLLIDMKTPMPIFIHETDPQPSGVDCVIILSGCGPNNERLYTFQAGDLRLCLAERNVSVSVATSECTIEQSSIALKAKPSGPSSSKRLHKPKAPRTQTVTKYRQADIKRIDGCKDLLSRARKELWREVVLGEVTLFPEQDERSQCLDRCVSRAEQVVGPVFHNNQQLEKSRIIKTIDREFVNLLSRGKATAGGALATHGLIDVNGDVIKITDIQDDKAIDAVKRLVSTTLLDGLPFRFTDIRDSKGILHPFECEALFEIVYNICYKVNRNIGTHHSLADIVGGPLKDSPLIPSAVFAFTSFMLYLSIIQECDLPNQNITIDHFRKKIVAVEGGEHANTFKNTQRAWRDRARRAADDTANRWAITRRKKMGTRRQASVDE